MSFAQVFPNLPLAALHRQALATRDDEVRACLAHSVLSLEDFARLISPAASRHLESLGQRAHHLTLQRFGRVMRFFAPLYISNECINNCQYCGFSRDNPIFRVTLSLDEVQAEAASLRGQGFRQVLLVAGEHPKFISNHYLADCVRLCGESFASVALEVGPMETPEYQPLCRAGAEGLVVYQETYDPAVYAEVHTVGPKRNFSWRLDTPERAYAAGFRRLGIGALLGLADWRGEAIALAAHAQYLMRHCWKAQLTLSVPRLRPHAGSSGPRTHVSDRDLAQFICALRLFLPDAGIVLSTREPAALRDGLIPLGITLMSAGSHTEPGGYTGAGRNSVHRTERGRQVPIATDPASVTAVPPLRTATTATEQFAISDDRSPELVAATVRRLGYEPVWKDWDMALAQ